MTQQIPYESLGKGKTVVILIFLLAAVWYLPWRAGVLNEDHLVFSVVLYGAELFSFFTIMLHLFMTWRLTVRKASPAPPVCWSLYSYRRSMNLWACCARHC